MTIIDAIHGRQLFRPLFKDVKIWRAWEVYLRGCSGWASSGGPGQAGWTIY